MQTFQSSHFPQGYPETQQGPLPSGGSPNQTTLVQDPERLPKIPILFASICRDVLASTSVLPDLAVMKEQLWFIVWLQAFGEGRWVQKS